MSMPVTTTLQQAYELLLRMGMVGMRYDASEAGRQSSSAEAFCCGAAVVIETESK